jgi:putative tricarboxylic transport membrane protein
MSSVGLTILIGDLLKQGKRDKVKGAVLVYTVRDAVKNATYVGKTIVPLLVIGQPTGSMSAGSAASFFQKLDILGTSARDYLVTHYSYVTSVTRSVTLIVTFGRSYNTSFTFIALVGEKNGG